MKHQRIAAKHVYTVAKDPRLGSYRFDLRYMWVDRDWIAGREHLWKYYDSYRPFKLMQRMLNFPS